MVQIRIEQLSILEAHWSLATYSGTYGDGYEIIDAETFEANSITGVPNGDTVTRTRGIITNPPANYCQIYDSFTNSPIADSNNRITFARLTYSSGNYIITYYALFEGVEEQTTLNGNIEIKLQFPEVMQKSEAPLDSELVISGATGSSSGEIQLTNDFGGTASSPLVIGLQDRPLSSAAPTDGYVITWSQSNNYWYPAIIPIATNNISGSIKLTNDLSGTSTLPQVIGLRGNPINSLLPDDGYGLIFNNGSWTPVPLFSKITLTSPTTLNTSPLSGSEYLILIDTSSINWSNADNITLPASPNTNSIITVKDSGGQAGTKSIDIVGNGYDIDGNSIETINLNYGARRLYFDGTQWLNI